MSFPLVLLGGRGAGKRRDAKLEHPDDYAEGGLGHLYKLAELTYKDQPFAVEVLNRYTSVRELHTGLPAFNPIYIAGPEKKYAHVLHKNLNGSYTLPMNTDGELHENIDAVSKSLLCNHPHSIVIVAAGDLLPEPAHLEGLVALLRKHESTADVVLPEIKAEALNAVGVRKKSYSFFDENGAVVNYNFGQVYGLRPSQVRWDIFSHAAKFHYGKRAKGFMAKTNALLFAPVLLAGALTRPRNARSLVYILTEGILRDIQKLRSGNITLSEAETAIGEIALIHDVRRKRNRRVVVDVNGWTSLAADVDTIAEASTLGVTVPEE